MRDANRLPLKTRRNVLRWQSVPISSMWLHNLYSGPIDKIRWLTGGYEWKSRWITTKVNYTLGICLTSLWFIRIYLISSITADALGLKKRANSVFSSKLKISLSFQWNVDIQISRQCKYSTIVFPWAIFLHKFTMESWLCTLSETLSRKNSLSSS